MFWENLLSWKITSTLDALGAIVNLQKRRRISILTTKPLMPKEIGLFAFFFKFKNNIYNFELKDRPPKIYIILFVVLGVFFVFEFCSATLLCIECFQHIPSFQVHGKISKWPRFLQKDTNIFHPHYLSMSPR